MSSTLRKLLLGGVAVVLFGVAGYLLFVRGGSEAKYPTEYFVHVVDLQTKQEAKINAKMTEAAPYLNPATGQRTFYPWWFCQGCRYRFVPPATLGADGAPHLPQMPSCSHCGKMVTGPWIPEGDPDVEKPAGDAPLPALPK